MSDEKASILGSKSPGSSASSNDAGAIYHDSSQSPRARMLQILFVGAVLLMVLICIILSIYRGVLFKSYGAMYFMLGISLIGFVFVELCLIVFIRRGDLPKGKTWFLYFVGVCVMLEAIFTNVLLFQ